MTRCTNSVPSPSRSRLAFLIAVIALPALGLYAQPQTSADADQKASIKARPCIVETSGEVTYLIKNGVELSVTEDWDCDRVADAYDNCVGMANETQTDSDGNGIGDVCEAATFIKARGPAKSRSNTKLKVKTANAPPKTGSKSRSKAPTAKAPSKPKPDKKANKRTAKAADKRSRSSAKRRRSI